jgi:hypothetical protein
MATDHKRMAIEKIIFADRIAVMIAILSNLVIYHQRLFSIFRGWQIYRIIEQSLLLLTLPVLSPLALY